MYTCMKLFLSRYSTAEQPERTPSSRLRLELLPEHAEHDDADADDGELEPDVRLHADRHARAAPHRAAHAAREVAVLVRLTKQVAQWRTRPAARCTRTPLTLLLPYSCRLICALLDSQATYNRS